MLRRSINAWKMLMLSLPKGIIAFVIAITGLCVSLPLVIIWVGLPLLALTLTWCRTMMISEQKAAEAWSHGKGEASQHIMPEHPSAFRWEGLRTLGYQLRQGQSYRGILYSILQLPAGILGFTLALALPSVAISALLSPVVQRVSSSVFSYDQNMLDPDVFVFLSGTTPDERSWIVCGMGFVLLLMLPLLLSGLGRLYTAWINMISGTHQDVKAPLEVLHNA
ncbi:sensor domain-containing protein [Paenibacillus phytohabitans]|uniref:sensor domain-containing protein n=1 Tax=Paenibacillus phytohabitans TaxID=2654978 RepID=UPI0030097B65